MGCDPLGESAAQNHGRRGSADPYRIGVRSVGTTTASLPPDAAPKVPPYWARAESRLTERKCLRPVLCGPSAEAIDRIRAVLLSTVDPDWVMFERDLRDGVMDRHVEGG
jgi:hypothetical protein